MRYLAALEQHRHFGRAAQACHITQPALSNAVRALEEEFGVAIVRRGRQYEGLTTEGERVLAAAHRMLHEREALRQELRSAAEQPQGGLAIGAVPTATPVAARFAAWLQARHPRLRPAVRSLSSTEIETGIDALSLDIAFGYIDRLSARRVEVLPQYTEHYFLLRRAEVPGTPRIGEPITWHDAAQRPQSIEQLADLLGGATRSGRAELARCLTGETSWWHASTSPVARRAGEVRRRRRIARRVGAAVRRAASPAADRAAGAHAHRVADADARAALAGAAGGTQAGAGWAVAGTCGGAQRPAVIRRLNRHNSRSDWTAPAVLRNSRDDPCQVKSVEPSRHSDRPHQRQP